MENTETIQTTNVRVALQDAPNVLEEQLMIALSVKLMVPFIICAMERLSVQQHALLANTKILLLISAYFVIAIVKPAILYPLIALLAM